MIRALRILVALCVLAWFGAVAPAQAQDQGRADTPDAALTPKAIG